MFVRVNVVFLYLVCLEISVSELMFDMIALSVVGFLVEEFYYKIFDYLLTSKVRIVDKLLLYLWIDCVS